MQFSESDACSHVQFWEIIPNHFQTLAKEVQKNIPDAVKLSSDHWLVQLILMHIEEFIW